MRERVYETAMGSIHYWMDVVNALIEEFLRERVLS